jgi:CBS domain-containing protein
MALWLFGWWPAVAIRAVNPRRKIMKVNEAMSREVRLASPDDPIREVARLMREIDSGVVPVGDNDRLVGMITDRDIAIRAVGEGKSPDTPVREVMTRDMQYCFDDEDVGTVCEKMADQQIRRLPVVNRDKRLVGILSLGDLAQKGDGAGYAGHALGGISQQGGPHSQTWAEGRA